MQWKLIVGQCDWFLTGCYVYKIYKYLLEPINLILSLSVVLCFLKISVTDECCCWHLSHPPPPDHHPHRRDQPSASIDIGIHQGKCTNGRPTQSTPGSVNLKTIPAKPIKKNLYLYLFKRQKSSIFFLFERILQIQKLMNE